MNKITGLIVGGIMLLLVAGILVKVFVFPSTEAPTRETTKTGFMEIIEVDAKITDVLDAAPSGGDNAAEHYAKAVEVFFANQALLLDAAASLGQGKADGHADALKTLEEIRGHVGNGAKQAKTPHPRATDARSRGIKFPISFSTADTYWTEQLLRSPTGLQQEGLLVSTRARWA